MGRPRGPSFACRLVAFLGGTEALEPGRPGRGLAGLVARWAGDHVTRCPRCRADQAEWLELVQLLKRVDRPQAPPHLYASVMARIAAEGRRSGSVALPAVPTARRSPRFQPPFSGDPVARSLALGMVVFLAGWAVALGVRQPVLEGTRRSLEGLVWSMGPTWERLGSWVLSWQDGFEPAVMAMRWIGLNLPGGPHGWGFWTAVGLVNALAIVSISLGWRREHS